MRAKVPCPLSAIALAVLGTACARRTEPPAPSGTVTISIVGTNDLHGRIASAPVLGGYVENLRRARARDGGGVVLVDAGDMFQGTLESNLGEGAAVIRAYEALGYAAAAVGNHEFDFGPVGERATPESDADDAQGALKARAAGARFPLLCANLLDGATRMRVDWPNMPASVVVEVAGVRVGIVGVTTEETPRTTIRANFRGLAMAPVADTIVAEARRLRADGAAVVVALAHAGGRCESFQDADAPDRDRCEADSEIFRAARAIPKDTVDVIVAGHSHAGVAHRVNGVVVIESFSYGKAFGRVDLTVDRAAKRVMSARVHPPQDLCKRADAPSCETTAYEGAPVVPDERVAGAIAADVERARAKRATSLGVRLEGPILRSYGEESPLGNLFADLMRAARPTADVGLINGGGLRADLPAGELVYGSLFEAFPFDNKLTTARVRAKDLRVVLEHHFSSGGGILSVSGVHVEVTCAGTSTSIRISRDGGKQVQDDEVLEIVASDFMLTGGDDFWGPVTPPALEIGEVPIREAMATALRARSALRPTDLFDPAHRRMVYPGKRPLRCSTTSKND